MLSQVSDSPDIVGKYFKIINSTLTSYIKVKRVEFNRIFNDYVIIGSIINIEFNTELIKTTVIMRADSLFLYNNDTWEEITKEDYEKVLKEALTYF